MVVVRAHFQLQLQFVSFTHNYSCDSRVDLTSIGFFHIGAIYGVETNNSWILVESLSKSDYPVQIGVEFQFQFLHATREH